MKDPNMGTGFKVTLTPKVPKMTTAAILPAFSDLLSLIPQAKVSQKSAQDFDWAIHPGGANILAGARHALGITQKHLRASHDIYANHGNSSSTTIMSVLDRLRDEDMDAQAPGGRPKEYVVGCAFGPGMVVETCLLRRPQRERPNGNGALRKASIRVA
jgi:fungal type III polyketide synthase